MTAKRVLDFVVYIAIGLVVGIFLMWLAFHSDRSGAEIGKWLGLAVNTPIVFGYAIKGSRPSRKRASFWGTIFLLLCVHLLASIYVLRQIEELKAFWWIVIVPAESIVINAILFAMGFRPGEPV